jgi:phosphatidylserine synthase
LAARFLRAPLGLPNALTLACLGLGFLSALAAGRGDVEGALRVMALAALADALAGLTAQGLSLGTELGAELDSLASLMVWGVAASLLLYSQGLQALGAWGLALAGLVAVGAAWRLCRGDVQGGRDRYHGLPLNVGGLALVALAAGDAPPRWLAAGAVAVVAAWLSPFTWPRRPLRLLLAAPLLLGLMGAAVGWRAGWIIPAVAAGSWALFSPLRRRV